MSSSPQHAPVKSKAESRLFWPILIPVTIVALFLFFISPQIMQVNLHKDWQTLDDLITVDVVRSDGTQEHYDSNTFPVVSRGDRIIAAIPLPEERVCENAALCTNIFHAALQVFYGDELIFTHGLEQALHGRFIGNAFQRIPLRDEMRGGQLTLVIDVTENNAFSNIRNTQVMSQLNSVQYFYAKYQTYVPLFLTVAVVFAFSFLLLLISNKHQPLYHEGLFLSLFNTLLALWYLGSRGYFYSMSSSPVLPPHIEYVCIFALPIPFCLYMYTQETSSKFHRVFSGIMTLLYSAYFLLATVLNYTTRDFHYSTFLLPLQLSMVVSVVIFIYLLTRRSYNTTLPRRIIRYGTALSMFFLITEVLRLNVIKFFPENQLLPFLSFAPAGMLLFSITLVTGYLARVAETYGAQSDKALLRRMAYLDVLTGISNRAFCHQQIEEMKANGVKNFALLFFDINGLKWANDNFGHEMGDKYIQAVADALSQIFGHQRFCARWGGDEFVVCLTGKNIRHTQKMLRDFDEEIKNVNISGAFPFPVSVAYGVVYSSEACVTSMDEALREADRRMYQVKIRMREQRPPESAIKL